jgi:hypothetical protein
VLGFHEIKSSVGLSMQQAYSVLCRQK